MGGNTLRTLETAAAQVGATVEEIEELVAGGRLRVLPLAGGRWITTARAVSAAMRGEPRRRRRRRTQAGARVSVSVLRTGVSAREARPGRRRLHAAAAVEPVAVATEPRGDAAPELRRGRAPEPRRDAAPELRRGRAPEPRRDGPPGRAAAAGPIASPPPRPSRSVAVDTRADVRPDRRLDLTTAALHLGVTPEAALHLMRSGRLPATRLGREWVTSARALADHRSRAAGRSGRT